MRHGRFTEEQIVGILREQEPGLKTPEACRPQEGPPALFAAPSPRSDGLMAMMAG
jgi:putative transposase